MTLFWALYFMPLVFEAAPCELKPLVQGARYYFADSANLDFLLLMLFRMPLAS